MIKRMCGAWRCFCWRLQTWMTSLGLSHPFCGIFTAHCGVNCRRCTTTMTVKVYRTRPTRRALQCLYLCRKNFASLRPSEQFPHHPSLRLSEKVARSAGWGQIATDGRMITPNLVRIVGILTQQGLANYWSSSHQASVAALLLPARLRSARPFWLRRDISPVLRGNCSEGRSLVRCVAPKRFDCAKAPLNMTVWSVCSAINSIMPEYIKSVWQSGAKMLSYYGINEAFTARSLFFLL